MCGQEMNSVITFVPGAKKLNEGKDHMKENSEVNIKDNMVIINDSFLLLALIF